jgi:hypothetical protein
MSVIPENDATQADLVAWFKLYDELASLKARESLLRGKIFKSFFKTPKEGTNNHELNDGTGAVLKGTYVINRAVDIGALDALKAAQAEAKQGSNVPKLNFDQLIKWKPEVAVGEYRKLTEEERNLFDQCLVIKVGSPQLEITIPKKKEGK